jgi:hypothetical protein
MTLIRRAILALVLMTGIAPAIAQIPAAVPALPDTERRTSYSISASTCACAVNFALYGDSTDFQNWVEVYIDGTRYNFNDASHGWTITSPSGPLANLARPVTNAVLTFNTAQTGTVQIVGARRPRRTLQWSEGAGVPTRNLNQAFTDIIATMRETWDKTNDVTGRALLSQPGVTLGLLPTPAVCAGALLGFDIAGLQPNCVSNLGSGNVTLPVVDGHSAVFDGTTGRLKDGGPAQTLKTYSKLADAVAAFIPSSVDVVEVLGHNSPGDNGRASYTRIAPSSAAAWRFQSADGQWWAVSNRAVTPEVFGCFNGSDCTSAFAAMGTWLSGFSGPGSTVNGTPGADYKIWPAGTSPGVALVLENVKGLIWNFNGSRISSNNTFLVGGQPQVFFIGNSTSLTFNGPEFVETAWSGTLSPANDAVFFYISDSAAPYSGNMYWTNIKQNGGTGTLFVASGILADNNGFFVANADISNTYYGFNFQKAGNGFFARGIKANNTGRVYFPYGVHNHDVEIVSANGGGPFNHVLLKVYADPLGDIERRSLSDIKVTYRNKGRVNATASASLVALDFQQQVPQVNVSGAANNGSGKVRLTVDSSANMATGQTWFFNSIVGTTEANGTNPVTVVNATTVDLATVNFVNAYVSGGYARVPAYMKNIDNTLDVDDVSGNGQPTALLTYKHNSDGTIDTTTDGYTMENIKVSGTLKGYGGGTVAIDLFKNDATAIGTWTGENIRNIFLRDLTIPTGFALVDATNIQANLVFENIYGPASTWTLTGGGTNTRFQNVAGVTGLTDHLTVAPSTAPSNQWANGLSNQGVVAYAQVNFSDLAGSLACSQTPALTGDVTKASASCATVLPTVNANVGTFGSATSCVTVTNNAKGLTTAISAATCTPAFSSITGQATLAQFPNLAANTALVNATSGSAVPTAFAMPSCSSAASALTWTTNSGFACNTSITAAAVPLSGITGLGTGVGTAAGNAVNAAGGLVTVTAANQISRGMEAQGVARSVVGVTGNATANVADIQGTASQWFGVNAAGTGLSFQTLGGDCTGSITAIVCTKTNGATFATVATSGSASDLSAGTLPAARMPAMTGDVTTSAGAVATTIASNAVTNAKAAQMAANTIKGNNTGSTANASDLTVPQTAAMLNQAVYVTSATGVNFNAIGDTALALTLPTGYTRISILRAAVDHCSATTTTAQYSVFTTTGGGGTGLIPTSTSTVSATADATVNNFMSVNGFSVAAIASALSPANTLQFRVMVVQGSAVTCDVAVLYYVMP